MYLGRYYSYTIKKSEPITFTSNRYKLIYYLTIPTDLSEFSRNIKFLIRIVLFFSKHTFSFAVDRCPAIIWVGRNQLNSTDS